MDHAQATSRASRWRSARAGRGLVDPGAGYVLDGLGLDMERDFTAIYLDRAGDGPAMVLDGRAAALWGGGVGWPGFARVAGEGGRFIAPDAGEIGRIRAKHAFLKPLTVPAGAYPGQGAAIHSVGSWAFILARDRDGPTTPATAWPARCTRARPPLAKSSPRPGRRPRPTPPPPRPSPD